MIIIGFVVGFFLGQTGNINSIADQSTTNDEDFSPEDIVITGSDYQNV